MPRGGGIDLNGFDQQCKSVSHSSGAQYYCTPANTTIDSSSGPATLKIVGSQAAMDFPGTLRGHASLNYASTSANTLSLTGGVHTTDGALRVTKGKLRLGPKAAFSSLSELEVSGTGELTLENGDVNPGSLVLKLAVSGKLTLAAGVTQIVDQALVNGVYLDPGVYTKDSPAVAVFLLGEGAISGLNAEKPMEGATFTWVGEGADMNFTTAANWQGGTVPTFDGTERLMFSGGAHTYIEEPGVQCGGTFAVDYGGTLHLMSTNNSWGQLDLYKCTVQCHATNTLVAKTVKLSDSGVYHGNTTLDLNGYDQSIGRIFSGLPVAERGSFKATVKSETPATLTIAGADTSDDWGPFLFTGAVSLVYDKGGSLQLTNNLSTTTGSLEVRKGTVKFLKGAGWTASTNVVLNGGTIAVGPNAGATALGSAQDQSVAWLTYESGALDVAAGERATVQTVVYMENGKEKSLVPGTYWAADTTENVPAKYKLAWLTGAGSLRVLKSAIPLSTFLIVR